MNPSEMSDQELTRAVAEEVMGWKLAGQYTPYFWWNPITDASGPLEHEWQPLTDARHWMMVVERMRGLGWFVTIIAKDDGFIVLFEMIPYWAGQYGITDWFSNPNIGRAVLEAALAAVMGKEGG